MKGFIFALSLAISTSAGAATHSASRFVHSALTQGKQIMEVKDDNQRLTQLCGLLRQKVHVPYVTSVWLGDYAKLRRDRAAVQRFPQLVPSILISKAFGSAGGETGGTFQVDAGARPRGNNIYAVGVTVTSDGGSSYRGKVIVHRGKNGYKMIDGEYMGFSAINHQGREYQRFLNEEYNKNPRTSKPVSALIQDIQSQPNYMACP